MGTLNSIYTFISQLLTLHSGQFVSVGQRMYTGFATIMIACFGVKAALSAHEHSGGFHFGKFADLILMIAFGYAMINYYDAPIPGFGRSFCQLIKQRGPIYFDDLNASLRNPDLLYTC